MTGTHLGLERFLFNLNTLAELGEESNSSKDFNNVVKSALYMVMGSLFVSKGIIFKYEHDKKTFYPLASKGVDSANEITLKLTDEAIKEVVKYNMPLDIRGDDPLVSLLGNTKAELEKFGARVITFLVVNSELIGAISLNDTFSGEEYTAYDFQLLSIMTRHISFILHSHSLLLKLIHTYNENKELYENLRCIYQDTIHSFATAIDAKDAYTKSHSHRVSVYSAAIAKGMGWASEDIESVRIAGLLHDIGKIAIDKSIINKSSMLTDQERQEIFSHPVIGYDILSKIKFPWKNIPIITRNHHERLDGSGYPDKLKKDEILMGARIMTFADSFDAMTTNRPYRPSLSFTEAMNEINKNCDKQFDPDIVHTFLTVIQKETLGKPEHPSIISYLQEQPDSVLVNRLLESFPKT